MPIAVPEVGVNCLMIFTPTGGGAATIKNSNWTYKPMSKVKEAPNSTDGMLRAPGLFDASGTGKGYVDTTVPIEGQVTVGTIGVLQWYRKTGKFFSAVVIITDLDITTGVDDIEEWDFSWSLQSGLVTNPV